MMTQEQKSLDYSSHANVFQDNSAIPLRPRFRGEKRSRDRGEPSQPTQLLIYDKKVDAFARAKSARTCSDCPDPAERANEFYIWKRKLTRLGGCP